MSVVNWGKPKKVRSTEDHNSAYGADGAPPGAYVPNMSDDDNKAWKGKVVHAKSANPHIELRKHCEPGSQILIFVSKDGWDFPDKSEFVSPQPIHGLWRRSTKGYAIRISCNGPIWLKSLDELQEPISEAMEKLNEL